MNDFVKSTCWKKLPPVETNSTLKNFFFPSKREIVIPPVVVTESALSMGWLSASQEMTGQREEAMRVISGTFSQSHWLVKSDWFVLQVFLRNLFTDSSSISCQPQANSHCHSQHTANSQPTYTSVIRRLAKSPQLMRFQGVILTRCWTWLGRISRWTNSSQLVKQCRIRGPLCPANVLSTYRLPPSQFRAKCGSNGRTERALDTYRLSITDACLITSWSTEH